MKLRSASPLPTGREGRVIAVGIAVVIPLVLWFGVGAPLAGWYAQRAASLAERQELARHLEQLVATIPDLQRRAAQEQSGEGTDWLLAGNTDAIAAAALQEKVQAMAGATGATIASVEILPVQELGSYRRIGLRVAVYARAWSGLAGLLQRLEQDMPKMLIAELEIRALPSRNANSDTPTSAIVTILGYRAATHER